MKFVCITCALLLLASATNAQQESLALVTESATGQNWSVSIQILVLMTLLTLLPAAVLSTSAFVRIIIVLSILRQALGTAQTPPNQVLLGVALFLTFFVMSPVINNIHEYAAQPYIDGQLSAEVALQKGIEPLRNFMLDQTRESDLAAVPRRSRVGTTDITSVDEAYRYRLLCRALWSAN